MKMALLNPLLRTITRNPQWPASVWKRSNSYLTSDIRIGRSFSSTTTSTRTNADGQHHPPSFQQPQSQSRSQHPDPQLDLQEWYQRDRSSFVSTHFINVTSLAQQIRQQVRDYTRNVQQQRQQQQQPPIKLVGILVEGRIYSETYSSKIAETCQEDGLDYQVWNVQVEDTSEEQRKYITSLIQKANEDPSVDGILVFYPILGNHDDKKNNGKETDQRRRQTLSQRGIYFKTPDCQFRDIVCASKDVEGLRGTQWYYRHGRRRHQQQQAADNTLVSQIWPCTARSVQAILEAYHDWDYFYGHDRPWQGSGKDRHDHCVVSIVNRSEIVGRPLASMLASSQGPNSNVTVYSIDESSTLKFGPCRKLQQSSKFFEECLKESQMIVTGVPNPDFRIPLEYIPAHATLVNVSEFPNVDELALLQQRPDIRYIPQVGKVTVAILEDNLVQLHRQRMQQQS